MEKWQISDQNHGLTPLEKSQFFDFLNFFFFFSLERRCFVLKYRRRLFLGLYCLKKKVEKLRFFGPKPWVNPFAKMSIFRLFELLFFIT